MKNGFGLRNCCPKGLGCEKLVGIMIWVWRLGDEWLENELCA